MSTKVKLHYVITSGGDGSASVHFVKNNKLARIYDEFSQYHEPWGEGEAFEEDLEFDDKGVLLDEYCTDVEEKLREAIASECTSKRDLEYKRACERWLREIEEDK